MSKLRHDLLRTAPTFGAVRTGVPNVGRTQGYVASCTCGARFEAGTKPKVIERFNEHKAAMEPKKEKK